MEGNSIAVGRGAAQKILVEVKEIKVLLMGNPNVGKSVVFSRLTGLEVISSNFPGTTVEFMQSHSWIGKVRARIIDVHGAYSLEPSSKAEEVALKLLKEEKPDVVINVIDATNLERNLYLTLQILEQEIPTIVVLNKWDVAKNKGITIDVKQLAGRLKAAAVPVVAVTGEGIKQLTEEVIQLLAAPPPHYYIPASRHSKWQLIGEISASVQKIIHKHPTFLEKFADQSIQPVTGLLIAVLVLGLTFFTVRGIAEFLINSLMGPLYYRFYYPFIINWIPKIFSWPLIQQFLLGGNFKTMESFGILTTGLYIPLVLVLPYIFSFYLVMSFLEDLGYLPRLAVLLDGWLHRIGLHGYAGIPAILGLGCKVPAIMATRILESKREKFIAMVLICLVAPCLPQSAMIFSVLGKYGFFYLGVVFGVTFLAGLTSSFLLGRILKGETPELFLEIPAYQWPALPMLLKKLWMRVKGFLFEAVPLIAVGVFIVNILEIFGGLRFLTKIFSPVVTRFLGLPAELVSIVMVGFLRKDISIALLLPYHLTAKQLTVAVTFLVLYLPCLATFFVVLKELGLKDTLKILLLTLSVAFLTAIILNILII